MILAAWVADAVLFLTGVAVLARALTRRPSPAAVVPYARSSYTPTRVIDGRTYPSAALQRTLDEGRLFDRQQANRETR